MRYKKALIFSMDAFLAATLIITALVLLLNTSYMKVPDNLGISYTSTDIITAFSNIKIEELNNTYIQSLISNGIINNTNNTILEQIGEFYVTNNSDYALNLTREVSLQLIPPNHGFSIIVNDDEIYKNSVPLSSDLVTSRRLISGIEKYKPVRGATSKVYLQGIIEKNDNAYFYFGGFIGQGNLSMFSEELPDDASITSFDIKTAFGGNFSFYVNDNNCRDFNETEDKMNPDLINLDSCIVYLVDQENNFTFISNSDLLDSYLAGGYIKIGYKTSKMNYYTVENPLRHYLPEIDGVINIYDSVYTTGSVKSMKVHLHYNSSQYTYLNIAGANVYSNNANGTVVDVIINNTELDSMLSYSFLSNKTIPIRMASYNLTTRISNESNADVVLITDLSASMKKNFDASKPGNDVYNCPEMLEDAANSNYRRYNHARCLDNEFIDVLFGNASGARVWPIEILFDAITDYSLDPTDEGLIRNDINSFPMPNNGRTCISCAINKAYEIFAENNESNRSRYIVLMTDGVPNYVPDDGVGGISTIFNTSPTCIGYCDINGDCGTDPKEGCFDSLCDPAFISAKDSMQRIVDDFNVTLFAIGFGALETDCPNALTLLEEMANISINGTYNVSNDLEELQNIYKEIAYEILETADQIAQLVNTSENFTSGKLYGDSYIEFNITSEIEAPNFGEIELTLEEELTECNNTVDIPTNIRYVDGFITSYSDIHWTHKLFINNNKTFDLEDFGVNYWRLGDPFNIFVPANYMSNQSSINMELADSPTNITSECSSNNSLIYMGAITAEVSYSDVLEKVIGCNWTVDYDDGGSGDFLVPPNYAGSKKCYYTKALIDYDSNDTYDDAMFKLMEQLDFDGDGAIFVDLGANDLIVNSISIMKIPYPWGPTIAEVRIWK
ncbi:hypothetical protein C0585_00765 [Candidatus Woesearchaeota archaeon]|nr:MAG: hypothetical protein C0585_00765 [Candidatus Woesearchaeota archaeon]